MAGVPGANRSVGRGTVRARADGGWPGGRSAGAGGGGDGAGSVGRGRALVPKVDMGGFDVPTMCIPDGTTGRGQEHRGRSLPDSPLTWGGAKGFRNRAGGGLRDRVHGEPGARRQRHTVTRATPQPPTHPRRTIHERYARP